VVGVESMLAAMAVGKEPCGKATAPAASTLPIRRALLTMSMVKTVGKD
jgi:hypothetical protein